jgi:hypothetical protein
VIGNFLFDLFNEMDFTFLQKIEENVQNVNDNAYEMH